MSKGTICVVGLGPGHPDYTLPAAVNAIEKADILIGGQRHLEMFNTAGKESYAVTSDMEGLLSFTKSRLSGNHIVFLASGDPGFYGILDWVKRNFPAGIITVIPGLSSVQYLFSRLGQSWKEAVLLSLHGQDMDLESPLLSGKPLALLTDYRNTPGDIARRLLEKGEGDRIMTAGFRLSYEDELIITDSVRNCSERGDLADPAVVIVYGK